MDFTLDKYGQLCREILQLGLPAMTMAAYLHAHQPGYPIVILRHDVDRGAAAALSMAKLEAGFGLQATYYFRAIGGVFKPEVMKAIEEMGHEVGYHYETLAKSGGDARKAEALFSGELAEFRKHVAIHTASMHGSPLSRWDNLEIWRGRHPQDYGLLGEASLSIDYQAVYYLTDTGRTWADTKANRRDRAAQLRPARSVATTDDLIAFLAEADKPLLLNAHPNRWASSRLEWAMSAASDGAINLGKRLIGRLQEGWRA
ncbi:MAG: hypothetical protein L0Z70_14545 [Chloroflexi bacterium]|nr:hypothetical protein [Chloroflexota bacterium]